VEIVSNPKEKISPIFSDEDLAYQETRRQRKVRKLDFDIK
jgi:hypothetical protein